MSEAHEFDADSAVDKLPSGWAWVSVEGLATNEAGALTDGPFGSNLKTSHYTKSGPRVIRLQNIGDGAFHDEKAHIAREHFERLRKHEAKPQDIVVAMLGEKLPRACLVPDHVGPAIVKADCARLRVDPKLALPGFVAAGLNSWALRRQADELVHGVGRPRLGLRWLKTLQFPLAPVPEQRRIVEAIESYFTRLDDAVATLERVQRNLKRYRASVLKAAVEGRLVPTEAELARAEGRAYEPASVLLDHILVERRRCWQEAGKRGEYQEPMSPHTGDLPGLPEGWCWASVDGLLREPLRNGHSARKAVDGDVRILTLSAVTNRDFSEVNTKLTAADRQQVRDLWLEPGDIFIERSNTPELVGTAALYRGPGGFAIFPDLLIRVRAAHDVLPLYVEAVLRSARSRTFFQRAAQGIAGSMPKISQETVAALAVPLPPRMEQIRIVAELERQLSVADETEASVAIGQIRCARLRQAILRWAFEGKLADQDPSDEPTSVLLERIRSETLAGRASGRNTEDTRLRRSSRRKFARAEKKP